VLVITGVIGVKVCFNVTAFGVKVAFSIDKKREYVPMNLDPSADAELEEQASTVGEGRNVT